MFPKERRWLPAAFGIAAGFSLLFLIFSQTLPRLLTANYYQKSLGLLRDQAQAVKKEFAGVLKDQSQKLRRAAGQTWPETTELRFKLFKDLRLDLDIEGIAAYAEDGTLTLWLGNVLNLEEAAPAGISDSVVQEFGQALLIKDKASSYLVSLHWVDPQTLLVLYRLLAFSPKLKSPYLEDYHFMSRRLRKNCTVDTFDFREDVSGYDKIFSRHNDEYIGQPSLQGEVQSIFFPLRNDRNQILARVSLRSPSLATYLLSKKEAFLVVFYLGLAASLILLLTILLRGSRFLREKKFWPGPAMIIVLACFRLLFFPLSRLERFQSLPLFSPTLAGFFSLGNLTKSPADIFLTSLCLFALLAGLAYNVHKVNRFRSKNSSWGLPVVLPSVIFMVSAALFLGIQNLCGKLVLHSSLNLLKFDLSGTFILLHLSIILCVAGSVLFIHTLLQKAARSGNRFRLYPLLFFAIQGAVFIVYGKNKLALFLLQFVALGSLTARPLFKKAAVMKSVSWAVFLLQVFFIYGILHHTTSVKSRSLIENFLKNTIQSQEDWARFIMDQSLKELDKQGNALLAFLKNPETSPDPTRDLWESILASKFNWYSSLEILDAGGTPLSRFSLNVPSIFRAGTNLPSRPKGMISRLSIPFMGKEKDFLIGYKDWRDNGNELGRTVIYLSLDYELLPFLYSANPYFELLRVNSLPSLNQFDFRMAVFDLSGNILFNPNKISTGLSSAVLESGALQELGLWTTFMDKGNAYRLYAFRFDKHIYAFFSPQKNLLENAIDYFKLLLFYSVLFVVPAFLLYFLYARRKIQHPLWSFANRVYISFIFVALVPLFLFTFFSRSFFNRIFTQRFIEKAEIHANIARSVMDDFIYLQQQEKAEAPTPPEDLVLWISTTISNDVNLYEEGRLVSSSRGEFFDAGLLPGLIDGEIYYKIQFENNPFYTQERAIGNFSFQTLNIPYASLGGRRLMISLPFPFEQQEISTATQELIEFFLFISVFFIATVLVLARGIGTMIVTPIHKLLAGTKEASLGNLDFAIEYKAQDEMKTLIDGFNAMIKNLKDHQQELADMGKKAAWAEMARKVAHEIKNPLTPIQLSAEHLLRVYKDKRGDFSEALKESISYIIGEVENLRRIAQEFLEISKEAVLHKEPFSFDDLVRETVAPYKKLLEERIRFQEAFEGEGFLFEGDRAKLKIALRNILTNAIESIHGKGEIRVRLSHQPGGLAVRIEDTGEGIEKDILDRIFEPYFSTKDVGTGLGLPIAKKIVEDHQGSIEIASEPKKGTKITIRFRSPKA